MYLFCPKCQSQFPAGGHCPRCSSRLQSPVEVADSLAKLSAPPPRPIQVGIGGRFAVGCVIALGLHIALLEWTTATLSLTGGSRSDIDLWLGFTLRFVALIPGALIAGAGRPGAFSSGLAIGLLVTGAWLIVDPYPAFQIDMQRGGMAVALVLSAGAMASIGGRIWPPSVYLPMPASPRGSSMLGLSMEENEQVRSWPTQWARILATATLVVISVIMADEIRKGMSKLPAGLVQVNGAAAARSDLQITAVLTILAGILCGASTGSGFRHGLITAVLAIAIVLPLHHSRPAAELPGIDFYLELFTDATVDTQPDVVLGIGIFLTIALAGWLGGQLFPPISKKSRRRNDSY